MKNILIITTLFLFQFNLFSQTGDPFTDQVRTRVTELPTTHPIRIAIDPIPATPVVPDPPPTIDPPQHSLLNHDSIRNIYWIHGFGGNQDRWTDAREATRDKTENKQGFKARIVDGVAPTYEENGGLNVAAQTLAAEILSTTTHQSDELSATNYLIGHSQGGILGRYMVSEDECGNLPFSGKTLYGGLVTFSSAMNGAQIINSRVEGKINDLIIHSCNVFSKAQGPFVQFILKKIDGSTGPGQTLCETLTGSLVPLIFSGVNAEIGLDYIVGSHVVATMNDCPAGEIAKVAFYGIEPYTKLDGAEFNNPIFYRTVQHFFTEVNTHPTWEANDDSKLAIQFSDAARRQRRIAHIKDNWAGVYLASSLGIPSPQLFISFSLGKQARAHRQVSKLYHDMGDFWMVIIGAKGTEQIITPSSTPSGCRCTFLDETVEPPISVDTFIVANSAAECPPDGASQYCGFEAGGTIYLTYTIRFNEKPSDGVVLQESAQHMVGATFDSQLLRVRYGDTGIANEPNTGSSHMQARNDRNTRDALRALYDGTLGPFFRLEIQQ